MKLVRRYSNRFDLQERLAGAIQRVSERGAQDQEVLDGTMSGQAGRVWRVRDRLRAEDIEKIIEEFRAGKPKHVLAEQYGISLSSIKVLLRQRGVKRDKLS